MSILNEDNEKTVVTEEQNSNLEDYGSSPKKKYPKDKYDEMSENIIMILSVLIVLNYISVSLYYWIAQSALPILSRVLLGTISIANPMMLLLLMAIEPIVKFSFGFSNYHIVSCALAIFGVACINKLRGNDFD